MDMKGARKQIVQSVREELIKIYGGKLAEEEVENILAAIQVTKNRVVSGVPQELSITVSLDDGKMKKVLTDMIQRKICIIDPIEY